MQIKVKRIYQPPTVDDIYRVLVDRLWPRGISKANAKLDLWAKDITPSNDLRKWFHAHRQAFAEFEQAYQRELANNEHCQDFLSQISSHKTITLLTAAKEIEHSHVPTLQRFIGANLNKN